MLDWGRIGVGERVEVERDDGHSVRELFWNRRQQSDRVEDSDTYQRIYELSRESRSGTSSTARYNEGIVSEAAGEWNAFNLPEEP